MNWKQVGKFSRKAHRLVGVISAFFLLVLTITGIGLSIQKLMGVADNAREARESVGSTYHLDSSLVAFGPALARAQAAVRARIGDAKLARVELELEGDHPTFVLSTLKGDDPDDLKQFVVNATTGAIEGGGGNEKSLWETLHGGEFWGQYGVAVNMVVGFVFLLLILTGLAMYGQIVNGRMRARKRKRAPAPGHSTVLPAAIVLALLGIAAPARAQGRKFANAYSADTGSAGAVGVELHGRVDDRSGGEVRLGYGLTDRWSLAARANVLQATGLDSLSLVSAWRFGQTGQWPVDTGLVMELARPLDPGSPMSLQGTLVLERALGNFVTDGNVVVGKAFAPGSPRYGATWGLGYRATDAFEPGLQVVYGDTEFDDGYADKLFGGVSLKGSLGHTSALGGLLYGGANEIRGTVMLTEAY